MARSAEAAAREEKIAELKRLITNGTYETSEKLEEAVDAFLWSEQDQLQAEQAAGYREIVRSHPK
jgi:anti-sigma28 factor (negative regulator of flagellin synthesis)